MSGDQGAGSDRRRALYHRHIISFALAVGAFFIAGVVSRALGSPALGVLGLWLAAAGFIVSGTSAIGAGRHAFGIPNVSVNPGLGSPFAPRGRATSKGAKVVGSLLVVAGLVAAATGVRLLLLLLR